MVISTCFFSLEIADYHSVGYLKLLDVGLAVYYKTAPK